MRRSSKHPKDKATHIFDLMEQFAGYGFNKSHSAAYALLAYHTAYLKTHYPVEFMAALLTSEISKPENVVKYISECREMEIAVEPPNVQISDARLHAGRQGDSVWADGDQECRPQRDRLDPGSAREAGRGGASADSRRFWEFCEKVDLRLMNKRVLESLIKAGALDCFGRRAQLMAAVDKAMERAQKSQRDCAAGQHGLFGGLGRSSTRRRNWHAWTHGDDPLPNVPDWDENQRLQSEKEVLGFFVSGHPMDKYAEKLRNLNVVDTATALEMKPAPPTRRGEQQPENEISIAGVIVGLKVAKSKRSGELYAQAALEDTVGKIDLICFSEGLSEAGGDAQDRCAGAGTRAVARGGRCGAEACVVVHPGARRREGEAAAECAHQGDT